MECPFENIFNYSSQGPFEESLKIHNYDSGGPEKIDDFCYQCPFEEFKKNTIVTRKVYKYNSESSSKDSLKNPHL